MENIKILKEPELEERKYFAIIFVLSMPSNFHRRTIMRQDLKFNHTGRYYGSMEVEHNFVFDLLSFVTFSSKASKKLGANVTIDWNYWSEYVRDFI